jgi:2-oxoisovalerate dehydrogenase E1 component beta subunit
MIEEQPVSLADAAQSDAPSRPLNMIEAINEALDIMMARDPDVVILGEDVGYFGGVFRATAGLQKKYGKNRVFDTPINECGIVGAAVGMAAYYPGLDQLVSEAARMRYRSAGEFTSSLTIRSPFGGGIFGGQTHSQSPEALFTHVAGLKTVIPCTPYDAKGLLIAAIEDNDPVIFFEPKRIYNGPFDGYYDNPSKTWKAHPDGQVPEGYYKVSLGKARVVREGAALTVLAYGTMIHVAEAVLAQKGVDAEIIDLRTLVPLDIETVEKSVQKTGKCLVIHEATRTSGFGAELSALVQERCFYHLEAPVERVTGFDTPYPHSLEWAYFPGPVRIGEAVDRLLKD